MIKPVARQVLWPLAKNTIGSAMVILATTLVTACSADIEADKRRFPAISNDRLVGSKCSLRDSASIKRVAMHPLGPTGGWNLYATNNSNKVDYQRTKKLDKNSLTQSGNEISGYVKFAEPGYLQARSYDDVYGDVYCGWSPNKLEIEPTKDYVYVTLETCSVGDGGLDQVHEVSWFPRGQGEGIIIFSSAHPDKSSPLGAADLYRPDRLGSTYQFNDRLASETISDYLRQGNEKAAQQVIAESLAVLTKMRDLVDGSTKKPIAAKDEYREKWALIQNYQLGLALGQSNFDACFNNLEATIAGPYRGSHMNCKAYKKLFPIYQWLNNKIVGKPAKLDTSTLERSYVDSEPITIAKYLLGETPESEFQRHSRGSAEFWIGVNRYLAGDKKRATENFQRFLEQKNSAVMAFEVAAAAKLKQNCEKQTK